MSMVPVMSPAGEGEQIYFGGGLITFRVPAARTGGVFAIIEDVAPRGKTTPLHLHPNFDEAFYVLEGELLVHSDGAEHVAAAGAVAFAPRNIPHAFLVTSEIARFLTILTPGDIGEGFLRAGGDAVADPSAPPPPLDIAKVLAAGESTGAMEVLGPPPFASVGARH